MATSKKKTTSKKAAPKKPAAKKSTKPTTKKPSSAVKSTPKKSTKPVTKKGKSSQSTTREVVINNKLVKLPKRLGVESYSCIWRIYNMIDQKTKESYTKRFWIVIGDGHKRYRKFETLHEAIRYFRALKKFARMRVQSVHSKDFIRTVYTFYEMAWSGIEIEKINPIENQNVWKTTKIDVEDDNYEDEFTQYDTKEVDYGEFNEEEVNRILAESEGDAIVIEPITLNKENKEEKKPLPHEYSHDNQERTSITELVGIDEDDYESDDKLNKTFELDEENDELPPYQTTSHTIEQNKSAFIEEEEKYDPYEVTGYISIEDQLKEDDELPPYEETAVYTFENTRTQEEVIPTPAPIKIEETQPINTQYTTYESSSQQEPKLYDLADREQPQPISEEQTPVYQQPSQTYQQSTQPQTNNSYSDNNDDEFDITQHNTALTPTSETPLVGGKHNSKLKVLYWLFVGIICLVLAAIVVIALLAVGNII